MRNLIDPPARIWVRGVSRAYASCIRSHAEPIDVERARQQHDGYVRALEALGHHVRRIDADDAAPDCCFVEDVAVLWHRGGVLTRPGAPARADEVDHVGETLLDDGLRLERMAAPAQLDGGDVMRVAAGLCVGLSTRTSSAGMAALRDIAQRQTLSVFPVTVRAGLHLKTSATLLDADTVLVHDSAAVNTTDLQAAGLETVLVPEPQGCNVLAFGRHILVSAAAPKTAELIRARGFEAVPVDISELHRGDGALSCLSLREPAAGRWCV